MVLGRAREAWAYLKFAKARRKQLEANVPDIWKHKTVLYIGAWGRRRDFLDQFRLSGYEIDVLEAYDKNLKNVKNYEFVKSVIKGDAREVDKLISKKYDVVFWWNGPEHVYKKELSNTLRKLKKISDHLVVCACPWGTYKMAEVCKNGVCEAHISHLIPKDFEKNNFKTSVIGERNSFGSNILAWWERK